MSEISIQESIAQIEDIYDRAESAWNAGAREQALAAYRELLDHPCAHHEVDIHMVHDEVHQLLRGLGRYDEAIEAKRSAIKAGYRSVPDPEADIAETLIAAGRRDEADVLYAELKERDPEDVWLYSSAGWAYGGVDDREALRWLLDGIEVAIATGDPDQVIRQLLDMTLDTWDQLEEDDDTGVVDRVEIFIDNWERPPYQPRFPDRVPADMEPGRCGHCGFDPDHPQPEVDIPAWPLHPVDPEKASIALSVAWFPADEWTKAVERWPDLLEDNPEAHDAYSHRIESYLKMINGAIPGRIPMLASIRVDELVEAEGDRAGTAEARARFAARKTGDGRTLSWPPGRNDRCWCGSGRKYKKCCGPCRHSVTLDGIRETTLPEPARWSGSRCGSRRSFPAAAVPALESCHMVGSTERHGKRWVHIPAEWTAGRSRAVRARWLTPWHGQPDACGHPRWPPQQAFLPM